MTRIGLLFIAIAMMACTSSSEGGEGGVLDGSRDGRVDGSVGTHDGSFGTHDGEVLDGRLSDAMDFDDTGLGDAGFDGGDGSIDASRDGFTLDGPGDAAFSSDFGSFFRDGEARGDATSFFEGGVFPGRDGSIFPGFDGGFPFGDLGGGPPPPPPPPPPPVP